MKQVSKQNKTREFEYCFDASSCVRWVQRDIVEMVESNEKKNKKFPRSWRCKYSSTYQTKPALPSETCLSKPLEAWQSRFPYYEDLSMRQRRRTNPNEIQRRRQRGFLNEVRTIDLGITNMGEPPRGIFRWWRQIKQSWPFFVALWDVLTGLVFLLWDKARSRSLGKTSTVIRTSAERYQLQEDDQCVEDNDNGADDSRRM
jgi:hypothetical protein